MGGFIGLDLASAHFIFKCMKVPESEWGFLLDKLQILGNIASKHLNKDSSKSNGNKNTQTQTRR